MDPSETTPAGQPWDNKAKSRSVALPPELWKRIDGKVDGRFGGNRSAYFRQLVDNDMAGVAEMHGRTVLVDLARAYHPGLAEELATLVESPDGPKVNQSKILARLLETVATALRVVDASERNILREESAIEAELRRHRLIEGALEAVTDHLVGDGLLQKTEQILQQPSALARRRASGNRGGEK